MGWFVSSEEERWSVRDVWVVNISLLAKWRWRLLNDDSTLWKAVLKSKYGGGIVGKLVLGDDCKPWFASLWWRDICSIGHNLDQNWFSQNAVKKLGNGRLTSFWYDRWIGNVPFCVLFPRLFSISTQKEASVADVYNSILLQDNWVLGWRRSLFEWEKLLLVDMLALLNSATLRLEEEDRWGWVPERGAHFSVKSTYQMIFALPNRQSVVEPWNEILFSRIWKSPAPSKVCGFVWQLLHGRIPTRKNLASRRVLQPGGDVSCVLCGEDIESELHLFVYCEIAMLLWMEIFHWLDIPFCLPHNLFSIFLCLMETGNVKGRQGMLMIRAAVVWILWKCRNSLLFDNGNGSVSDLVNAVKLASWKWWLSRSTAAQCLFYEWCAEPRLCLLC
jgi:hypothetical protein